MTHEQAIAYNQAIEDVLRVYKHGIGAIRALKIKQVVVVEHLRTTTRQDVVDME